MSKISRRSFILGTAVAGAAITISGRTALAGGHLPKVDPSSSTAKALAYTHTSTTDGQMCNNCQLFKGAKSWVECPIFPGKEVAAEGWCKSWVKKTG